MGWFGGSSARRAVAALIALDLACAVTFVALEGDRRDIVATTDEGRVEVDTTRRPMSPTSPGRSGGESMATTTTVPMTAAPGGGSAAGGESGQAEPQPPIPATSTRPPTVTSTSSAPPPPCRNSHDPACGPFRWSPPPPPNSPINVQITVTPAEPRVGEVVTFRVVATDGETRVNAGNTCYGDFGCLPRTDGSPGGSIGYGEWTPPPLQPTTYDSGDGISHRYETAGTFTFRVEVGGLSFFHGDECPGDPARPSGSQYDCFDPYAEHGVWTAQVTVRA